MRKKAIFRQFVYFPYIDLTPLAGVSLALAYYLMLTCSSLERKRGIVSLQETPYAIGNTCFSVHSTTETIISLSADGRVSFAITDTALQAAVFRKIGKAHTVAFTTSESSALGTLPYLATAIDQLPSMSINSSIAYQAELSARQYSALNTLQLAECAATTKALAPLLTNYPTSFFLSISAETNASNFLKLIYVLQDQGINRFYLVAHSN